MKRRAAAGYAIASVVGAAALAYNFYGVHISGAIWAPGDETGCNRNTPIVVTVKNWSFRRVVDATLRIEVWKNGVSNNILQDPAYLHYNQITEPFRVSRLCYSDPYFDQIVSENTSRKSEYSTKAMLEDANRILPIFIEISENSIVDLQVVGIEYR